MKNTFYILLLGFSFGYAQEAIPSAIQLRYQSEIPAVNQLLKKEDFKLTDGRMLVDALPCKVQNDEATSTVFVSVVCQLKAFNRLGVDKINDMIRVAQEKVRKTIQLNYGYQPKEIKMAYIPDSQDWSLTSSFTVSDGSGIVKEWLLAMDFDSDGKFEVMKRVL
jgi:hypothetical protein